MAVFDMKHWQYFQMAKSSRQLGDNELENKEEVRLERDMRTTQMAKVMKPWGWE